MGSKVLFILVALCIIAVACMLYLLPPTQIWCIYVVCAVALVILFFLLRRVIVPADTAMKGMELIAAQDFNNRLTKVREHNADKIVKLFNSLIDKLRNERLRNLEQDSFLRLLIDASPMGVMMLDFEGKVSMVNQSMLRITGIQSAEEIAGLDLLSLPTDLSGKMADVPLGENRIIRRGDVRMYRCYHLSFVQTGFPRHFYLLESLTEEVMKAEREAYEKVIRIISHEVNNTMGGVKSVLELLHDSTDEEDVREVIESCDDRCERMCSFISAYADVVKVPEPVLREVDLNREISAMLPFLKEMAGDEIFLDFVSEESSLQVNIDIALIQQVIVNIVKNAVESIKGKGYVEIRTGKKDGNVWIEISNNGSPISEEISRKLFSPFFTTKKEGRGLGLTLIGEILKRHKARFSLRTGYDRITRFHIDF